MDTDGSSRAGGARLRYVDVRPYTLPKTLAQLTGPNSGKVTLSRSLAWGPRRSFDLADSDERRLLYELVVQEASTDGELGEYLDRAALIELWPQLSLPARCRRAWQERFPELARRVAA